jgi:hypothetical protein
MRPRTSLVLFVALLSLIGTGSWASANVLPRGTVLNIRTTQPIFADEVRPGSMVRGVVYRPITVRRRVIIPSGSPAMLQVVDRSSNLRRVDLTVSSIRANGRRYVLATNDVRLGSSRNRGRRGLIGAGAGAVAGGMIGGGTGAAVGATTGAGIGLVTSRRGRTQLEVPAHTRLEFRVR